MSCFFSFRLLYCIRFMWQGFGSMGAAEVASVRWHQGLPLYWAELLSAGSKTNLLLAKAESISDAGGACAIAYLRKGEKTRHDSCDRRVRICEKQLCNYLSRKKGRCVPGARANIAVQLVEKTMVMQVVHLQSLVDHSEAAICPAAHGGFCATVDECTLKRDATCGDPATEQSPGTNCGL